MGKGETPARGRVVLLPPRPAPRADPVLDRTQLRAREETSAPVRAVVGALPGGALREGLPEQRLLGQSLVTPAMAAVTNASGLAPADALPLVAPKALDAVFRQPAPRHVLDDRVSVPRLPVVNLERPNPNWPDLTPSPVPRVSLVPPTGRIEPAQLRWAAESRSLPTVAPRPRVPAPAIPLPRRSKPAPKGWLSRRISRDLRSSKREIAIGLGIGIGLSFVLGKLGQTYLESRTAGRGAAIDMWTSSALSSPEPRAPLGNAAPSAAVSSAAVPSAAVPGAAVSGAAVPSAAVPGAAVSRRSPALAAPAAAAAPSVLTASAQSAAAAQLGAASFRPVQQVHSALLKPRSTTAARRPAARSQPNATESGGPDEAPVDELEPRGAAPLSPSESAGLGRELPL